MATAGHRRPTVTVLGGGHGAFAVAADLGARGFPVRLFEDAAFARSLDAVAQAGGIAIAEPDPLDHEDRFAPVVATYDAAEALAGADVVVFVVPAYAEERFIDLALPHLQPKQTVLFACGNFGGALAFSKAAGDRRVIVGELEALVIGGFKADTPASVRITGRKRGIAAAFLTDDTGLGAARIAALYPDATRADAVLQTSLGNLNPVLHAPVMVLNAGSIGTRPFRFYREGVTPRVGAVMEALDDERLAIGRTLGLTLVPALHRLREWYAGIEAARSLHEACTTNPAYVDVRAPERLDHRFLTEDVPFGLVPMEALARQMAVPTPVMTGLVSLASTLLGRDLRRQGRNAEKLGLDDLQRDEILRLATGAGAARAGRPSRPADKDNAPVNSLGRGVA